MSIGSELRTYRNGSIISIEQNLMSWFKEHKDELVGAALGGADCIIYDDEINYKFFKGLIDNFSILAGNFCNKEQIKISLDNKKKTVEIYWDEDSIKENEDG